MKRKNIIVLIVVAFALGIILYLVSNKTSFLLQSQSNSTSDIIDHTKTLQSNTLKFSITVPSSFNIKDEGIRVLISNSSEIIIVSRNGTQFTSLDEYIKDFDIKHKTQILNEKKLIIDSRPSFSRVLKYPGSTEVGDKVYFIYVGDAVYHISTNSEQLFSDLDQIAQSFRYTP